MANILKTADKIFKWEGGFVNDPADRGGATNMGVTIATWRQVGYDKDGDGMINAGDIKLLTRNDAMVVLRRFYWDRWKADQIINQSVADILVDWLWCSGKWGIVIPQKILNVEPDGIVGPLTIAKLNSENQEFIHRMIFSARRVFIYDIIKYNPSQQKFLKGWMNRLNDFKFSHG